MMQVLQRDSTVCRPITGVMSLDSYLMLQSTELFTLTYGALVQQLIKDYEDDNEVNTQLERM